MTARSSQARKLAGLLAARTGRLVMATYDGPRKGNYGGWCLEWCDGVTRERMREMASEFAAQVPILRLDEIRWYRAHSDTAQAVTLLLWIDADPERALTYTPSSLFGKAFDATDYPERAAEVWQRRGRALEAIAAQAGHTSTAEQLVERIRSTGWDATLEWVDSIADGHRVRHLRSVPPT